MQSKEYLRFCKKNSDRSKTLKETLQLRAYEFFSGKKKTNIPNSMLRVIFTNHVKDMAFGVLRS